MNTAGLLIHIPPRGKVLTHHQFIHLEGRELLRKHGDQENDGDQDYKQALPCGACGNGVLPAAWVSVPPW